MCFLFLGEFEKAVSQLIKEKHYFGNLDRRGSSIAGLVVALIL